MELKQTLEGSLRQRLNLPGASTASLVDGVRQRQLLGPAAAQQLDRLLRRLGAAELAVVSSRPLNVSDRALRALHQGTVDLLTEMKDHEEGQRDGRAQHG
jgi:hypothetical protein